MSLYGSRSRRRLGRSPGLARRKRGKRVRAGLADGKALALYRAARGLLAEKDFEDISVARLAKAGGCSVGAFYGRFADKKTFLEFLIIETFRLATIRAETALGEAKTGGRGFEQSARTIAGHLSEEFGDPEFAGIVRAAVKLGFADERSRAPFDEYRATVTERAIAALKPHLRRGGEDRGREAMQAAFGLLTDAAISKSGPMRPGSARMDAAVCAVIVDLARRAGLSAAKKKESVPKKEKTGAPEMSIPEMPKRLRSRKNVAL